MGARSRSPSPAHRAIALLAAKAVVGTALTVAATAGTTAVVMEVVEAGTNQPLLRHKTRAPGAGFVFY